MSIMPVPDQCDHARLANPSGSLAVLPALTHSDRVFVDMKGDSRGLAQGELMVVLHRDLRCSFFALMVHASLGNALIFTDALLLVVDLHDCFAPPI